MRILIAGTTYYPALNGQSVFMVNLAEGLARKGHDVVVLFPLSRSLSRKRNGVQLESFASISLGFFHEESYLPVLFHKVRQVFDGFQPEIVHIQDHYPLSWSVVRQAKKRRLKIVGTNHFGPVSLEPYIPGALWLKPILDRLLWLWMLGLFRRLDYVTAPSPAAVDVLRTLGLKVPTQAVTCGTDLSRFFPDPSVDRMACRAQYGLDQHRTVFLYVGRVDQEKRIDVMLRAVGLLQRDDIQLAIVGQGAALSQLQELAKSLRLEDRVCFTGSVPNQELPQLLNSADVFAMAGEAESLSIASLEAMACGLPVLLADAFALPELVTRGVNGYLFRSGDPQDAAAHMQLLADQRAQWKDMGRASLQKVQAHSLEGTLQSYETIYRQLLAGQAQSA